MPTATRPLQYSVGEEGSLDGEHKEEEDGYELPTAGTDGFAGAAQHDAEIGQQEKHHGQRDGNPPHIGMPRYEEPQAEAGKEGVGASGDAEEEDCEPARNVVGGQLFLLFAEGGEEHAEGHRNEQTEIDEIVKFGQVETEQVSNIKSCKHEQYVDKGNEEGDGQSLREADGIFVCTSTQRKHDGNGQGKGEDDVF